MDIQLIQDDITTLKVDAIVNAANSSLMGGGGVDGAIHRAAGPDLREACKDVVRKQGRCATGDAVITSAGNLPSKFVIHTVGPVWHGGGNKEADLLTCCYNKCLTLAVENDCKSIALPNISTGVFGFPKDQAATIAVRSVKEHAAAEVLDTVIFVCFDDENYDLYRGLVE